ncbi:MAG: hypothetical protein ACOX6K_00115 [Sphaerochaetaceae bacterium]|jgi:hypothetical protein
MKALIKFLIVATFAVVIFFPQNQIGLVLYWSLFGVLGLLVVAFYFSSYWVSTDDVKAVRSGPVGFSLFVGKLPVITEDDLIRGRLVIDRTNLVLYQRTDGKERTKGHHCKEVWSLSVDALASIGTGAVLPARKGLILYLEDGGEVKFACRAAIKRKQDIIKALGWDDAPELSPGFGATVDVEGSATQRKSFSEALSAGSGDSSVSEDAPADAAPSTQAERNEKGSGKR